MERTRKGGLQSGCLLFPRLVLSLWFVLRSLTRNSGAGGWEGRGGRRSEGRSESGKDKGRLSSTSVHGALSSSVGCLALSATLPMSRQSPDSPCMAHWADDWQKREVKVMLNKAKDDANVACSRQPPPGTCAGCLLQLTGPANVRLNVVAVDLTTVLYLMSRK